MRLLGPDAPVRHPAKRRRIKTVLQEMIYRAARVIRSERRIVLDLGRYCPVATVFANLYRQLAYG